MIKMQRTCLKQTLIIKKNDEIVLASYSEYYYQNTYDSPPNKKCYFQT